MHLRDAEIAQERLNNVELAEGFYRQALLLVPDYLPALEGLGRLLVQAERWDELVRMSAPIWVVIGDQEISQELPKDAIFLEVPDRESFWALCAALEPRVCDVYIARHKAVSEEHEELFLSLEGEDDEVKEESIAPQSPQRAAPQVKLEDDIALLTLDVACELLLEAVNADERLLVGGRLDPLVLVEGGADDAFATADGQKTMINRAHRLCSYALEDVEAEDDVFVQAFVSSSVYSAMNVFYEQVKPSHELEFHERMMDVLLARWGG